MARIFREMSNQGEFQGRTQGRDLKKNKAGVKSCDEGWRGKAGCSGEKGLSGSALID